MSSLEDIRFAIGPVRVGRTRALWSLDRDEWKAVLKSTLAEFKDDEVPNQAAVVTLKIVLALVPSLIAAVAIAAQIISTDDITALVTAAEDLIPGSAQTFVEDSLQTALESLQEDGLFALPISIGVGIFAASGAAVALIGALNKAYDTDGKRKFIGQRLTALGVLGALGLALIGMFIAIVLGPTLLELFVPAEVLDSPLQILITLGRYLTAAMILMAFFSFAFWFGPNRERPPLRLLTPGSVVGVVLWLLLSFLFGVYVSLSGSYAATYGVFAGVIVLLVWLNYSFTVLLLAAELDHELERHVARKEAAADPAAGADADPDATVVDLDDVTSDMPRHPGLMGAGGAGPDDDADQDGARAPRPPKPTLVGAAQSTPGAGVAARLWGRLAR